MLQHNKARYQPFWSDPLNPIFCLSLIFLAGTLRSLPVQVRLLLVLAAAGISPGCSLEGLMLKLKLQYFGHLMGRADSLAKTLMLGKIEGRRRRG